MCALGLARAGWGCSFSLLTGGETESTVHGVEELSFDSEDILLEYNFISIWTPQVGALGTGTVLSLDLYLTPTLLAQFRTLSWVLGVLPGSGE